MSKAHGFSLVETLLVVSIIGIIATLAVTSVAPLVRANDLASAAQTLAAQIAQARQFAATRSEPVELRIYQIPAEGAGSATHWRGLLLCLGDGRPVGRAVGFPKSVAILPSRSPLLDGLASGQGPFPGLGTASHPYRSLTFRPNGRVQAKTPPAASSGWYFAVADAGAPAPSSDLPDNFAAITVNPQTAQVSILRP